MGRINQVQKSIGAFSLLPLGVFALTASAFAQQQNDQPRPWRNADDPAPSFSQAEPMQPMQMPQDGPGAAPQQMQRGPQGPYDAANDRNENYGLPRRLTIPSGSFVTVRVNGWLSSDKNQSGDSFTGTLAQPIVVDGIVVAQRGETVGGRVTEAQKAGRVEGTSRLGLELTDLTLVDGSTVPIRSQMINRNGSTSVGRDVGAVAGTTALGAAIGAAADWGRGAAIGAGAGAAAGILGVLLTRGQPTVIYPETALTFRVDQPVTVATDRAPQAFRYAEQPDYQRDNGPMPRYSSAPPPPAGYPYPGPYYGGGYPYYSPGFSVYVGPRYGYFYGPRGYGYYRRR